MATSPAQRARRSISDSTPPRLVAWAISAHAARRRASASSAPPAVSKASIAPKPSICARRAGVAGIAGQARVADAAHGGMRVEAAARARRRRPARAPAARRACAARAARGTRPSAPGTAPSTSRRRSQRLRERRVGGHHGAHQQVGVPAEVLRRAVHDDVGAELQRPLEQRRGERVVDRRAAPRGRGRRRASAGRSATSISGFVGVSSHSSAAPSHAASVASVSAMSTGVEASRPVATRWSSTSCTPQ